MFVLLETLNIMMNMLLRFRVWVRANPGDREPLYLRVRDGCLDCLGWSERRGAVSNLQEVVSPSSPRNKTSKV